MFYIQDKETKKIIYFNEDKNKILEVQETLVNYSDVPILETDKRILVNNGNFCFVDDPEAIITNKQEKNQENITKARQAIEQGYVEFKDAQFETNAQTVGDLTATMLMMQQAGIESYNWLSKDDKVVELTLEDFGTLGGLIAGFKQYVWNVHYVKYKEAIENAETLEDLEKIEIIYNIDNVLEQDMDNIEPLKED